MENEQEDAAEKVSIMTLHAAKGLEFPVVFLPGWEDGLFPSQRTMDESGLKGVEEERRLAYVGITRAEEHCTISFAANRRIYNQWQSALPSRFIDELPSDHVEVLTPPRPLWRRVRRGSPLSRNPRHHAWQRLAGEGIKGGCLQLTRLETHTGPLRHSGPTAPPASHRKRETW